MLPNAHDTPTNRSKSHSVGQVMVTTFALLVCRTSRNAYYTSVNPIVTCSRRSAVALVACALLLRRSNRPMPSCSCNADGVWLMASDVTAFRPRRPGLRECLLLPRSSLRRQLKALLLQSLVPN